MLYGATSPIGGPLDLFIDAVPWKSVDEHADEGPMRCTVIGAWNSPAGGQQHILRVEYAGESERQGFIINATCACVASRASQPTHAVQDSQRRSRRSTQPAEQLELNIPTEPCSACFYFWRIPHDSVCLHTRCWSHYSRRA